MANKRFDADMADITATATKVLGIKADGTIGTVVPFKSSDLNIGGRNLIKNSKQTLNGINQIHVYTLSEPLVYGETYTATLNGISGVGASFQIWVDYANLPVVQLYKTDGVETVSAAFIYAGSAGENRISVYSEVSFYPSTINWVKIEIGNKATDWSPAPGDEHPTNTTTSALSSATLTSTYPDSNVVICPNITGGGIIYHRTITGWVQNSITVTS